MKNKIFALLAMIFVIGLFSANAQTVKKTTLDISGIHFCKMHSDDIMSNVQGVTDYEISSCGKYMTVKYDASKTNPEKIQEDVKKAAEAHMKVCKMDGMNMHKDHKNKDKCQHHDKQSSDN